MLDPTLRLFLENAGPFTFLCLQVSSLSTAFKIWSDKSVGTMSIIPFFTLLVNCVVWSIYGLLIDEAPIYAPNLCGSLTGLICTFVFQAYYPFFNPVLYLQGAAVISAAALSAYLGYTGLVGFVGSCLSIGVMASPLSVVQTVIRDRSTAALPFSTSLVMFATGLCWSLYGLLVIDDISVYLPNLLGTLLACVQLSLFAVYGFPDTLSSKPRGDTVLPYSVLKLDD